MADDVLERELAELVTRIILELKDRDPEDAKRFVADLRRAVMEDGHRHHDE